MFDKKIKFSNIRKLPQHKKKKNNLEEIGMIDNDESNKSIQTLLDELSLGWENWFNDDKKQLKHINTIYENNFLTNKTNLKNGKEFKKYVIPTIVITAFIGVISYFLLHLYLCQPICY